MDYITYSRYQNIATDEMFRVARKLATMVDKPTSNFTPAILENKPTCFENQVRFFQNRLAYKDCLASVTSISPLDLETNSAYLYYRIAFCDWE